MPMYHHMGQMWRLKLHILYYTCCTKLQNHIFRRTGKPYASIHVRAHPVICHSYHCFHPVICRSYHCFHCSYSLRCEMGRWGTSDESGRLCTLCPKQVQESKYHTLIQCSTFDHIRPCFPHIFDQAQSLHEIFSQPECALSIAKIHW